MSDREARIERIVRLRDERLKQAVRVLEESRLLERRMHGEFSAALTAREHAEAARRELSQGLGADILDFIEAEEWLRARTIAEELSALRLAKARASVDRALSKVTEARMKVRQLEQLKLRLEEQRKKKQRRAERVLEDEIGQRAARRQREQR